MNKGLVIVLVIVGVVLVIVAGMYFVEPAKSLPSFIPGYDHSLSAHHYKHGIGTLILGIGAFILAWFKSGKKSPQEKKQGE